MYNAQVMAGMKRDIAGFIAQQHHDIFMVSYTCHLIQLARSKGGAKLQANLNVTVQDAMIKIYYYSNRKRWVEEL